MRKISKIATTVGAIALFATLIAPANAQNRFRSYGNFYGGKAFGTMRNIRPGVPGPAWLFYKGVQGYHRGGWELGRMQSMKRYGIDPGGYPGFYNRRSWSRPW